MEETKTMVLADGRTVTLEDDDDIILSFSLNGEVFDTYEIPYPDAGYGGGFLILSPSEKYLVVSYFSGESEEAFSLFEIEGRRLKFLYDSGYLYGEEAHYGFGDNEEVLVQTFRTDAWYEENAKTDENGDRYYEFGELNVFHIGPRNLERHPVHVYPSEDWVEEETDDGPFLLRSIQKNAPVMRRAGFSELRVGEFHVLMPWGEETFHEPLPDVLVVRFA